MSNGLTDAAINEVLNHMFATGTYTKPTGHKLHLYKGDPHAAGAEVDVVVDDTAYLAQTITFEDEGTTTNNRLYNDLAATFAAVVYGSGAAAYDVTHWAVKDGSANILAAGAMPGTVNRVTGEPLVFSIGALYIELARTP
jgi:hypothetical protein